MSIESDKLDPDEPHTPLWVTLLGGGLFLLAAIYFVASDDGDAESASAQPASEAAVQEAGTPEVAGPATSDD